jgi:hypothetical protein
MKYIEDNEVKNELVKVYLCKKCGKKLKKSYKYKNQKCEKKKSTKKFEKNDK